jgi:hypothetical protein
VALTSILVCACALVCVCRESLCFRILQAGVAGEERPGRQPLHMEPATPTRRRVAPRNFALRDLVEDGEDEDMVLPTPPSTRGTKKRGSDTARKVGRRSEARRGCTRLTRYRSVEGPCFQGRWVVGCLRDEGTAAEGKSEAGKV